MYIEQCPLCGDELEVREVTPCIVCGALEDRVLHSAHRRDNFFEFIVYVFHEVTLFFTRLDLMPLERFRSPNGLTAAEFPDSSGWPERTPRLVQV